MNFAVYWPLIYHMLTQVVLETYSGQVAYDPRREDPKLVRVGPFCYASLLVVDNRWICLMKP